MSMRPLIYHLGNIKQHPPRLVESRHAGAWDIQVGEKNYGKVSKCKGSDKFVVVLRGTARELNEIVESGVLHSLFTKLV